MLDLAEVYWIRKQSHTDMFSEGYIGVTSRTAQESILKHFDNGWIPLEDDHWLSDFKKEGNE